MAHYCSLGCGSTKDLKTIDIAGKRMRVCRRCRKEMNKREKDQCQSSSR